MSTLYNVPSPGDQLHIDVFRLSVASGPEDCSHQEEAAAVHRPLQIPAQLSQPLLGLLSTGVSRAHKPGVLAAPGSWVGWCPQGEFIVFFATL